MKDYYIDPVLLKEIDKKTEMLDRGDSKNLSSMIRRTLEQDALTHSELLEANCRRERKERNRLLKETCNLLTESWNCAKGSFNGDLSHELILKTAEKIEPTNYGKYRCEDVRIQGDDVVLPVRGVKVWDQMNFLIQYLNEMELHPVEKSALFHTHFIRIHPLEDGNGRTARLISNLILDEQGYGPATILNRERTTYQGLLRSALRGYKERESQHSGFEDVMINSPPVSDEENIFYDFLADRVNISSDNQIDYIDQLPAYSVVLNDPSETGVFRLKRVINSHFKRNDKPGQVRLRGKDKIVVRGDIDSRDLDVLVSHSSKSKYTINKIKQK